MVALEADQIKATAGALGKGLMDSAISERQKVFFIHYVADCLNGILGKSHITNLLQKKTKHLYFWRIMSCPKHRQILHTQKRQFY